MNDSELDGLAAGCLTGLPQLCGFKICPVLGGEDSARRCAAVEVAVLDALVPSLAEVPYWGVSVSVMKGFLSLRASLSEGVFL